MENVAVLILAAGGATRFGSCKSLAIINGKPMLQHTIDHAREIYPDSVYVLSGCWHSAFCAALQNGVLSNAKLIENPDWANGIGCSISTGVSHLCHQHDGILILLADQIAVSTVDLKCLIKSANNKDIACSIYDKKRGVPSLFGRIAFSSLIQLSGDKGAKHLLYDKTFRIEEMPMETASIDIDTQLELKQWLKYSMQPSLSADNL